MWGPSVLTVLAVLTVRVVRVVRTVLVVLVSVLVELAGSRMEKNEVRGGQQS